MNKQILNIVGLLIIFAGLSVTATYAQAVQRVHIPFDFNLQNKTIAAGNYVVSRNDTQGAVWMIINRDTGRANLLPIGANESKRTASSKGKLTFNRYGKMYFIARLETSADKVEFPKSRAERRLIKELKASSQVKNSSKSGAVAAATPETITVDLTIE